MLSEIEQNGEQQDAKEAAPYKRGKVELFAEQSRQWKVPFEENEETAHYIARPSAYNHVFEFM